VSTFVILTPNHLWSWSFVLNLNVFFSKKFYSKIFVQRRFFGWNSKSRPSYTNFFLSAMKRWNFNIWKLFRKKTFSKILESLHKSWLKKKNKHNFSSCNTHQVYHLNLHFLLGFQNHPQSLDFSLFQALFLTLVMFS